MNSQAACPLAVVIALAVGGCATAAAGPHHAGRPHPGRAAAAATARQPLPAATVRRLPPGVFYMSAGDPSGFSYGVWQVSAAGGQHLILASGPGRSNGVRTFSATPSGIVASVADTGIDYLARITRHGVFWLPHGQPAMHGFDPEVTSHGELLYDTPPASQGDWTIWVQRSFSARPASIYRERAPFGTVAVGPGGQIATWRSSFSSSPPRHAPPVLIIGKTGHPRRLPTGYSAIANLVWGPQAPAIAVQSPTLAVELLFTNGKRLALPAGWYPYTWSPSGSTLLLLGSGPTLATWSLHTPNRVHVIGMTTPDVGIGQVSWLSKAART